MQYGGNKPFFDLMKEFKIENEVNMKKYPHRAAQYYSKKLRALVENQKFDLEEPVKTEWIYQTEKALGQLEQGAKEGAGWVKKQWDKSGIQGKISGFFNKE